MGSGKTSFMIDYINYTYRDRFGQCLNDEGAIAPKFLFGVLYLPNDPLKTNTLGVANG
jgi:hypothetical protein